MPESHKPRFAKWRLSDAHAEGYFVRVRCTSCRSRRFYRPGDLIKLLGDRSQERAAWGMCCELCGRKEYLAVDFYLLSGRERAVTTVRTLVRVKTIKRPIWRDELA